MARKAKETKQEEKKNYIEFTFKGKEIDYSGRLYPDLKKTTDALDITPMNLTINGVITIKGCKLMQSDKSSWINFPQYKDKDGKYQSYVYVDRAFSDSELNALVEACEKLLEA